MSAFSINLSKRAPCVENHNPLICKEIINKFVGIPQSLTLFCWAYLGEDDIERLEDVYGRG